MPDPKKKRLRHEPINFGRKPVNPKAATMNFGTWLSKSCATRTSRRPRALQTRYDGTQETDPTTMTSLAFRWCRHARSFLRAK